MATGRASVFYECLLVYIQNRVTAMMINSLISRTCHYKQAFCTPIALVTAAWSVIPTHVQSALTELCGFASSSKLLYIFLDLGLLSGCLDTLLLPQFPRSHFPIILAVLFSLNLFTICATGFCFN